MLKSIFIVNRSFINGSSLTFVLPDYEGRGVSNYDCVMLAGKRDGRRIYRIDVM